MIYTCDFNHLLCYPFPEIDFLNDVTDINECEDPSPCDQGFTCQNKEGTYECQCDQPMPNNAGVPVECQGNKYS